MEILLHDRFNFERMEIFPYKFYIGSENYLWSFRYLILISRQRLLLNKYIYTY